LAKIYLQGGTEHTLILGVREVHYRPFQATDWTDLRIGFFLSVTRAAADEDPTTLAETLAGSPSVPWTDRVQIGVISTHTTGSGDLFCGYTNLPSRARIISLGDSMLVSSDIGIGTTNARYWRPKHGTGVSGGDIASAHIIDSGQSRATAGDGSQMHFVQDTATAGGYCTLFTMRLRRDNATNRAKIITMEVKKATAGGHSSDILFSTDPSVAILQAQLESFPTSVNTLGPVELTQVPDTLFFYWPYHNSRLKIHSVGILKSA
jgi:hypothetical protein